ncbi:MAG: zinc ribbon domain-containing protein [Ruminococcus sp.]|nr:zinc ribbon domain-containing protein [Ruminococcus sp.]
MANILDKISGASKGVSDMSKSASESNNLKKKIAYEQERIQEVMQEIGKQYYANPNGDYTALCADIDDRKRRINSMRSDLQALKGVRICGTCGTRFDEKYSFEFCGKCGTRLASE